MFPATFAAFVKGADYLRETDSFWMKTDKREDKVVELHFQNGEVEVISAYVAKEDDKAEIVFKTIVGKDVDVGLFKKIVALHEEWLNN